MLTLVRQELHRLGFTDDQIDGGGLRVTTTLTPDGDGGGRGRRQGGPARHQRQGAPRRGGHGPARHRRAARLLRRPELPPLPDQLGGGRRHGRLDVQAGLARGGDHRRLLPEEHLGRQLAVLLPRRPRGPQRGRPRRAPATASAVSSVLALEQSINTAFVDMSDSMHDGPDKILSMANKMGIPPAKPDPHYPGIPSSTRDLEADALITLGKARISAINMANTYATIANGGQRADVHVIDKVDDRSDGTREVPVQAAHDAGDRPRRRRRRQLRDAAGRPARHRHQRPGGWAARRQARPAPRPTTSTRSPRRGSSASPRSCPPR